MLKQITIGNKLFAGAKIAIVTLLFLVPSCDEQNNTYTLDYRDTSFPDILNDSTEEKKFPETRLSKKYICKTDKKEYRFGEKILLTVDNQSEDTLYFFPNEAESARSYYLFSQSQDKESFKTHLVSENPSIFGSITYDQSIIYLHFSGLDRYTSEELGLEAFKQPLRPNQKMTFDVIMPNRSGYYRFGIRRYFHSNGSSGVWRINNFLESNTFFISDE